MIMTQNLKVDLAHDIVSDTLRFHEGDVNGSSLALAVFDSNTAFDLTGCTVTFDATIAGLLAEEDHAATFSANIITIPITENMTALSGPLLIDVKILKNSDVLILSTISAHVERSVINGASIIDVSSMTIAGRLSALESDVSDLQSSALLAAPMSDNSALSYYIDNCIDEKKLYMGRIDSGDGSAKFSDMLCVGSSGEKSQILINSIGRVRIRTGALSEGVYTWSEWSDIN